MTQEVRGGDGQETGSEQPKKLGLRFSFEVPDKIRASAIQPNLFYL
jgi:hypothetical protein